MKKGWGGKEGEIIGILEPCPLKTLTSQGDLLPFVSKVQTIEAMHIHFSVSYFLWTNHKASRMLSAA